MKRRGDGFFGDDDFDAYGNYIPRQPEPPRKLETFSLDELRKLPPPVALNDVLYRDSLAWLHGPPGAYKSFLAVQWAAELAAAGERVLYVAAEGRSGMAPRFDAWASANRARLGPELQILPEAVGIESGWPQLVALVEQGRPVLVVLDTQARMTPGLDENSAADVGMYVRAVDELRVASGACVLSVHHSARGAGNLRGSTALLGAADTVVGVKRPTLDPVIGVYNEKQKDSEQRPPYWLRPVVQSNGWPVLMECEEPGEWEKWTRQR